MPKPGEHVPHDWLRDRARGPGARVPPSILPSTALGRKRLVRTREAAWKQGCAGGGVDRVRGNGGQQRG